MRELMRRILWQATPLLVALWTVGFITQNWEAREAIATKIAPAYVAPGADLLLARAKKSCEDDDWRFRPYGRPDKCEFKSPEERKRAIDREASSAQAAYWGEQIKPRMEFIQEATFAGWVVFGLLLIIVLLYNLYRHIKENGMLANLGALLKAFRSRKAEHEFMRYKRLFENGLLSEEEFEGKKRELKPKVLHGQA